MYFFTKYIESKRAKGIAELKRNNCSKNSLTPSIYYAFFAWVFRFWGYFLLPWLQKYFYIQGKQKFVKKCIVCKRPKLRKNKKRKKYEFLNLRSESMAMLYMSLGPIL